MVLLISINFEEYIKEMCLNDLLKAEDLIINRIKEYGLYSKIDIERNRILLTIKKLECVDEIKTTQGMECPWTPSGVALIRKFKKIVENKK